MAAPKSRSNFPQSKREAFVRLAGVDIKQLRIFLAVAECGGFTAAEDVLNISQSTISAHISSLEKRLGYRLCRRGRAGFELTDRGAALREQSVRLIEAMSDFEDHARALKGKLVGRLKIAMIDNLITDPMCPIVPALRSLNASEAGSPRISIDVISPSEIDDAVAIGRSDIGMTIAETRLPTLTYIPLYHETDVLVCGRGHRLFDMRGAANIKRALRNSNKAVRSFLETEDAYLLGGNEESISASVTNIEAIALLVLAGTHIGFLPEHYARIWVDKGDMRILHPETFNRRTVVSLVHRPGANSNIFQHFARALQAASEFAKPAPSGQTI